MDSRSRDLAARYLQYIATDNRDAARRTVAGIFEKVQLLTKYPRLGHPYEPEQSREVRILLYGHYRIAYLINLTRLSTYWAYFMAPLT